MIVPERRLLRLPGQNSGCKFATLSMDDPRKDQFSGTQTAAAVPQSIRLRHRKEISKVVMNWVPT